MYEYGSPPSPPPNYRAFCALVCHRMNNKTNIEFGLRRMSELFRPRSMLSVTPSASANNIDLGLDNSGYPAQPHTIIVKYHPIRVKIL